MGQTGWDQVPNSPLHTVVVLKGESEAADQVERVEGSQGCQVGAGRADHRATGQDDDVEDVAHDAEGHHQRHAHL